MASLTLKSKTYYVIFSHGKHKEWVNTHVKYPAETEARKIKARLELERANGGFGMVDSQKEGIAFSDFADLYLKRKRARVSSGWAKNNEYFLRVLKGFFGNTPIAAIRSDDLERLIAFIQARGSKSRTCNVYLTLVNNMMRRAFEWGYIRSIPWYKTPKLKERDRRERKCLSLDEISRLLKASLESKNPFLFSVVLIALFTGMRRKEILNLEWTQIDFEQKVIRLKNKPEAKFTLKNYRPRMIPLHPFLEKYLHSELLRKEQKSQWVVGNYWQPDERIKDFRHAYAVALKRAGIVDAPFHGLRHTFASHLIMSGAPVMALSKILGHSSVKITMDQYVHLSKEFQETCIEKLPYGNPAG